MADAELYDLIVVGAGKSTSRVKPTLADSFFSFSGWFGLAAAKNYLEFHPDERVLVLESANSCGGTWVRS